MLSYIDFLSTLHKSTKRDYLKRVNDPDFPKAKAARIAKKWGFDYWDGDRRINYGGYRYIEGRWKSVAEEMINYYNLTNESKILDIGCGKGFLLYEFKRLLPGIEVRGIDISDYAIKNSKAEVERYLTHGCASKLPYLDDYFDFAFSINTFHNLSNTKLELALKEIKRVSKKQYFC